MKSLKDISRQGVFWPLSPVFLNEDIYNNASVKQPFRQHQQINKLLFDYRTNWLEILCAHMHSIALILCTSILDSKLICLPNAEKCYTLKAFPGPNDLIVLRNPELLSKTVF